MLDADSPRPSRITSKCHFHAAGRCVIDRLPSMADGPRDSRLDQTSSIGSPPRTTAEWHASSLSNAPVVRPVTEDRQADESNPGGGNTAYVSRGSTAATHVGGADAKGHGPARQSTLLAISGGSVLRESREGRRRQAVRRVLSTPLERQQKEKPKTVSFESADVVGRIVHFPKRKKKKTQTKTTYSCGFGFFFWFHRSTQRGRVARNHAS